jgi:hypothetical protein
MRTRVLVAGLVAMSILVIAGPASAKMAIAGANITGPGLGGGMRIGAPDADGLWGSGIDVAGGLDDARAGSVRELGLTATNLGPRYLVAYRFYGGDDLIRQDLYPYAKGGPVTYTAPGQELKVGINLSIIAGWHHSRPHFFRYLVEHGLPETDPVASRGADTDTAGGTRTPPWSGVPVGVLVGLAILSLAAVAERRRALSGAG